MRLESGVQMPTSDSIKEPRAEGRSLVLQEKLLCALVTYVDTSPASSTDLLVD